MGPSKKTRVISKRLTKLNELPDKEGARASKKKVKKRKLSDMLGSEWSTEELKHFYRVYRKYGKDWKKVASILQNRSVDMVEALYNMNKAYLSLPDGTATVAGLIAMMTDHYNILDGSDSDQERNDVSRISTKPHKHEHRKLRINTPKESVRTLSDRFKNQSGSSSCGYLSLLKRNSGDPFVNSRPRAVGKRTPRIPIADLRRTDGRASPDKWTCKSLVDADDDEVAYLAALALVEASQGGPPQIYGTPVKQTEHVRSSPVESGQRKDAETEISRTNFICATNDNLETSRSMQAEIGVSTTTTGLLDTEAVGDTEADWKVKKLQGEGQQYSATESFKFDDAREACNGTERSYAVRNIKYESDAEVAASDSCICVSQHPKKKNFQLTRGQNYTSDALYTLADLSCNILLPSSVMEPESDAPVTKQEREIDAAHMPKMPAAMSKNPESIKFRTSLKGERGNCTISDRITRGCANLGKDLSAEATQKCSFNSKIQNRKRKSLSKEVPLKDTKRPCVGKLVSLPKEGKSIQTAEFPALSKDLGKSVAESDSQDSTVNHTKVPFRSRNRRKMALQKAIAKGGASERVGDQCPNKCSFSVNGLTAGSKERLYHCLSSKMLRRWCTFEWFYSAIDYPWFARREFEEYLDHVQLGHVPRLTRVEWSVIRSSIGKARRFSKSFLLEERKNLELYRESVRTHYAEVRAGVREGLPKDLPRPLSVGQRVSARHPKTRELHNGRLLIVDYETCRVQFDRSNLGVELVLDIECMPLNSRENMPEDLRNRTVSVDKLWSRFFSTKPDIFAEGKLGHSKVVSCESLDADRISAVASSKYPWTMLMKHGDTIDATEKAKDTITEVAEQQATSNQPCTLAQIQEREADIDALDDLTRALKKKEALLTMLSQMKKELCGKQNDEDLNRACEPLRKQYDMVFLQLQDANDHVASALLRLRQCNSFQINSQSRSMVHLVSGSLNNSDLNQDSRSHVVEIVESSRHEARRMVDAAVQAMSSLKETEDTRLRTERPSSLPIDRHPGADSTFSRTTCSSCARNSSLEYQDQAASSWCEPTNKVSGFNPAVQISSKIYPNVNEGQLPSELISTCVATLLMIQSCTDRNYPPAEVAQIVEYAVNSLKPYCQQNLPIYREIQSCMGIIKSQMLALVPSSSSTFCQ